MQLDLHIREFFCAVRGRAMGPAAGSEGVAGGVEKTTEGKATGRAIQPYTPAKMPLFAMILRFYVYLRN